MSMFGAPRNSLLGALGGTKNPAWQWSDEPARNALHQQLAPRQSANERHWRAKSKGAASVPKNSLGAILEQALTDGLRKAGADDRTAARVGKKAFNIINDATPVGNVTGVQDGANTFLRGVTKGELGTAAIGAGMFGASILPGGAGKPIKKRLADILTDESGAIRAYHGSPHDFDKFEWSPRTRGTGEGAQAYGDGLYFAENPTTAKSYRAIHGGVKMSDGFPLSGSDYNAYNAYADAGGDFDQAIADSLYMAKQRPHQAETYQRAAAQLQEMKTKGLTYQEPGRLYEVSINAEPEEFLDWDRYAEDQPDLADKLLPNFVGQTGQLYNDFANSLGGFPGDPMGRARAAEEAIKRGIPGIRFLDQGSRNTGKGTSNYVVFNDKLIDILNKY